MDFLKTMKMDHSLKANLGSDTNITTAVSPYL